MIIRFFEISSDDAKYRKIAGLNLRGKGNERNDGTFENLFLNEIRLDATKCVYLRATSSLFSLYAIYPSIKLL